jgi:Peptidase M50B-like
MDAANAVPVIGTPLAYGLGFGVLVLVVLTDSWAGSLITVAHEGGHMIVAVLTLRGHEGFTIDDEGGGATTLVRYHWSISDLVTRFAGYATPPLLGLGGAALVHRGNAGGALVISVLLMVAAYFQARNALAIVVTTLVAVGCGWALFAGTPVVKVAVAVVLIWWMLLGGAYDNVMTFVHGAQDAVILSQRTWIPRVVWHALWAVIGVVCLWKGGRALLAL